MSKDWNLIGLDDLGVLRLRGPDAVRFLQGQVSNDVEKLTAERSQLAGYHNPQGRVIALIRLVQLAADDVLAVLPRELVASVASRLTKFVLRAKVKITDESSGWRVTGLVAPHGAGVTAGAAAQAGDNATPAAGNGGGAPSADVSAAFEARSLSWAAAQFASASATAATVGEASSAAAQLEESDSVVELPTASAFMLPDAPNVQARNGATVIVRVGVTLARWLLLAPAGEPAPLAGCAAGERDAWRLLDIADGVAQVYAVTSEEFVAQMLNLDALGGIAFDKGCYTGQEVIARAHYRGRVKRRMQRFLSRGELKLAVGESGQLGDGRAFKVVDAVQLANGRCEFLAVAPLIVGGGEEAATGGTVAVAVANTSAVVDAEVLPLAYPLPE
jgi:tRNA-modifying protein YgfZ